MTPDAATLFDAALSLPESLRADLAAQLIGSLDGPPSASKCTPDEWAAIIQDRSDALHRGEANLVDGEVALERIQAAIDRTAAKK